MFLKEAMTVSGRVRKFISSDGNKHVGIFFDDDRTASLMNNHLEKYITVLLSSNKKVMDDIDKMFSMQKFLFSLWRFYLESKGSFIEGTDEDARRDVSFKANACSKKVILINTEPCEYKEPLSWSYKEYTSPKDYYTKVVDKIIFYLASVFYPNDINPIEKFIETAKQEKGMSNKEYDAYNTTKNKLKEEK